MGESLKIYRNARSGQPEVHSPAEIHDHESHNAAWDASVTVVWST